MRKEDNPSGAQDVREVVVHKPAPTVEELENQADEDPEEAGYEGLETDEEPQGGRMSLVGHLTELRHRLIVCISCFLLCFTVAMMRAEWFTNLMLTRGEQFTFVYISPAELLISYIRMALICGVVVTIPVSAFEIWQFFKPGLKHRERAGFVLLLTLGLALFALGAAFAFAVVLPILLGFFARLNTTQTVSAMISVESYIGYVLSTMMTFGFVFETPIVLITLTSIGLVNPSFLQKNFKYVILAILVVAAIITPPDVTSQILVAVPLMVLFYGSILLCKLIFRRKLAREAAEEAV